MSAELEQLERLTGRSFRTREDVHAFVAGLALRRAAAQPSVQRWRTVKQATLFLLLAFAFVQYHLLDVLLDIVSLPSVVVFLPVAAGRFL